MSSRALLYLLLAGLAACGHGPAPVAGATVDSGTVEHDASASDALAPPADAATDADAPTRVRIMAANLTSGTQQSYDTPGIHIFQGLAPDIVLVQEFNYQAGALRVLVDTALGKDFSFYVEPRTGGIPNGIVSRFPIVQSGVWADASVPDRAFAYARINVPGPVDLWAVSAHLLTSGASQRATEAAQLLGYLQTNVPATDYLVVGGDFNTAGPSEQAMSDLSTEVVVTPPYPADQSGNANSSINRNHPHDWVLARANLDARKTPVSIGANSFAAGLVFDSRVYTPLADVAPIVLGDSAATGMQHMPVVRDFTLGGPN